MAATEATVTRDSTSQIPRVKPISSEYLNLQFNMGSNALLVRVTTDAVVKSEKIVVGVYTFHTEQTSYDYCHDPPTLRETRSERQR